MLFLQKAILLVSALLAQTVTTYAAVRNGVRGKKAAKKNGKKKSK
jgi:hypothetical protein